VRRDVLIVIPITAVIGVVIVLLAMRTADELVLLQQRHHHDQWVLDGSPATFLQRSAETPWAAPAIYAAVRASLRWACFTPSWAQQEPRARALIRRFRMLLVFWTALAIPAVVALVGGVW
jgi:hypothetical protein